jgi:hypothetical protein
MPDAVWGRRIELAGLLNGCNPSAARCGWTCGQAGFVTPAFMPCPSRLLSSRSRTRGQTVHAGSSRRGSRSILAIGVGLAAFWFGGCVQILAPATGSTTASGTFSSTVALPSFYQRGSFKAQLDQQDVTERFVVDLTNRTAFAASLTAAPGAHQLDVGARWAIPWAFIPMGGSVDNTSNFTVPSPPPVITLLTPNSGFRGSTFTITGTGFTALSVVNFGNATATINSRTATTINATVPPSPTAAPLGANLVTVRNGSVTSTPAATFTVTAPPMPPIVLLFRSGQDSVETISFTPGATFAQSTFQIENTRNVQLSPGTLSVSLARSGTQLVRGSSGGLETFTVGGTTATPTLTQPLPFRVLSGTGTGVAVVGTMIVRGDVNGLQVTDATLVPFPLGGSNQGASSTAGVAILADGPNSRVLRSTDIGLELWTVSATASPLMRTSEFGLGSPASGSALDWLVPGAVAVRASASGMELWTVSAPAATPLLNRTAASPMTGTPTPGQSTTGVAVDVASPRAVRATNTGIEVYDVVNTPVTLRPIGSRNSPAGTSATGVGVVVVGSVAFRTTASSIEAYDISNPTMIPAPVEFTTGLDLSATGVTLIAR